MADAFIPIGAPLGPRAPQPAPVSPEIERVAREFETVFLSEMLAPMFESLETDGLGGGGMGERMFRPMLVERYAQSIAAAGGVGISEHIIRELTRLQAVTDLETPDGADR